MILNAIKIRTAGRETVTLTVRPTVETERYLYIHLVVIFPFHSLFFFLLKFAFYCSWWFCFLSGSRAVCDVLFLGCFFFPVVDVSVCLPCPVLVAIAVRFFSHLFQTNWKHTLHCFRARSFLSLKLYRHRPFKTTHVKAFMNRLFSGNRHSLKCYCVFWADESQQQNWNLLNDAQMPDFPCLTSVMLNWPTPPES